MLLLAIFFHKKFSTIPVIAKKNHMYPFVPIKEWAVEERPREKMIQRGMNALTDAELMAILLATGSREKSAIELARDILRETGGLQELARSDMKRLTQIHGVGPAKALTLIAAFELGRRKINEDPVRVRITEPATAAHYLIPKMGDQTQEVFWGLFLNRNNEIIAEKQLFTGGLTSTVIDVRVVFKEAVQQNASGIIVAHNHPSGNLNASSADADITKKLADAGKMIDIPLLDHLIITSKGYYSFKENNRV